MKNDVFIIAEAGVNHNGSLNLARRLVDAAADAKADAVKFQTFRAERLVTRQARKAAYQKKTTGADESQFDMLKRLELDEEAHRELLVHCRSRNITFLSTPFDETSANLLVGLGLDILKIPSGEITNLPLLRHLAGLGKALILSTGMSVLEEVQAAVDALKAAGQPLDRLSLLHCNTQYPTPFEDANLRAILTLAETFPECQIGYSDHTPSIECCVAATAMGARILEKHFTLDRNLDGPDHAASLEPDELAALVRAVRNVEASLGDGKKRATPSERPNITVARKFLAASRDIAKGERFTPDNVAAIRTGGPGASPMRFDEIMDSVADREYAAGEGIDP